MTDEGLRRRVPLLEPGRRLQKYRVECDRPVFRNEEKSKAWLGPDASGASRTPLVWMRKVITTRFGVRRRRKRKSPEVADWPTARAHPPRRIQAIEAP